MIQFLTSYVLNLLACKVDPVYNFSIELVTGSFTDLSTKVERANWDSGIVDMLSAPAPGKALFELDNSDGSLTPRNNVNLVPGKAIKFNATHSGSLYPLFFGRITDVSVSPMLGKRTTLIEARDDWDRIGRLQYNTRLMVDVKPGSLFTELMSESMVQSFSADAIADNIPFAWYKDKDAVNALHELTRSGHYQILVDGNGTYRLRDRFWSILNTSVATYEVADDIRVNLSQESVINRTKMTSSPRQQITQVTTLAFLSQPIPLSSGQAFGFWVSFQDPDEPSAFTPVGSTIAQVASQDYYAAANSDGSGSNYTSQLSLQVTPFAATAVCSVYNAGPNQLYLTRFQIRGYPIRLLPETSAQYDVGSSQSVYGLRTLYIDPALVSNLDFMEQLTKVVTVERHTGRDQNKLKLTNEFPDVLDLDNGDVISLIESFTGYSGQWQIRYMSHDLSLAEGLRHSASYEMESFSNFPFLVLDHSTFGKLDSGRVLAI